MTPPLDYYPRAPTHVANLWNGPAAKPMKQLYLCGVCGMAGTRAAVLAHATGKCEREQFLNDFDATDTSAMALDLLQDIALLRAAFSEAGVLAVLVTNMHFAGHAANRNVFRVTAKSAAVLDKRVKCEWPVAVVASAVLERCMEVTSLMPRGLRALMTAELGSATVDDVRSLLASRGTVLTTHVLGRPSDEPSAATDPALETDLRDYLDTYEEHPQPEYIRGAILRVLDDVSYRQDVTPDAVHRHWWLWTRPWGWVFYGDDTSATPAVTNRVVDIMRRARYRGDQGRRITDRVMEWLEDRHVPLAERLPLCRP